MSEIVRVRCTSTTCSPYFDYGEEYNGTYVEEDEAYQDIKSGYFIDSFDCEVINEPEAVKTIKVRCTEDNNGFTACRVYDVEEFSETHYRDTFSKFVVLKDNFEVVNEPKPLLLVEIIHDNPNTWYYNGDHHWVEDIEGAYYRLDGGAELILKEHCKVIDKDGDWINWNGLETVDTPDLHEDEPEEYVMGTPGPEIVIDLKDYASETPDENLSEEPKPLGKHYKYTYKGIKLDPYRIFRVYNISAPEQQHAIKKLLRAGNSIKDLQQDIQEVIMTLNRWIEIIEEDKEND